MKRADLKLGQDYYYNRSNDWETYGYRGQKVTYVSTECFAERFSYRRNAEPIEVHLWDGTTDTISGSSYCPATSYDAKRLATVRDENGKIMAVPLAALRGPYDECKARIDERDRRRTAALVEKRQRDEARRERVKHATERLHDLGFTDNLWDGSTGSVSGLSIETLEHLIEAALFARENCTQEDIDEFAKHL